MSKLLSREAFREGVFARDRHCCVLCGQPAVDAHHILERRLWPDGGYYLANGAAVCGRCHLDCERTSVSVEEVRRACGIETLLVPPHLYPDQPYDKWGNPVLPNGRRLRGELFHDLSVQKILEQGGVLPLFTHWVKAPRTYHLPWSESIRSDDRVLASLDVFKGQEVVVTEKMDGENTSLYRDHYHARSLTSRSHPSQDWAKNFWGRICHDIPECWRVQGENVFAEHSIHYSDLPSYFLGFFVWDERNQCLDYDNTLEWFRLLGVAPVREIWRGTFDEKTIRKLWQPDMRACSEGYVMRVTRSFDYREFKDVVGKYVRSGHIQTEKHWKLGQPVKPNDLNRSFVK